MTWLKLIPVFIFFPSAAWSDCANSQLLEDEPRVAAQDAQNRTAGYLSDSQSNWVASNLQFNVPVLFHIVHRSNGEGLNDGVHDIGSPSVIQERIVAQLDQLNRSFGGEEAKSAGYPNARNARIHFTLYGINLIEDDNAFSTCSVNEIKRTYAVATDKVLNVYTCLLPAAIGLATLPGLLICPGETPWDLRCGAGKIAPKNHYLYGITLDYRVLAGGPKGPITNVWRSGDTLTHEAGHFFGLFHPYQNSCSSNMLSDQIADTPRMKTNIFGGCNPKRKVRAFACPNDFKYPLIEYVGNYMVATWDSCRNHFTPGQIDFMLASILLNKNFPSN